jgi:hypothetical protein
MSVRTDCWALLVPRQRASRLSLSEGREWRNTYLVWNSSSWHSVPDNNRGHTRHYDNSRSTSAAGHSSEIDRRFRLDPPKLVYHDEIYGLPWPVSNSTCMRGLNDLTTMFFSTDFVSGVLQEFKGTPWEHREASIDQATPFNANGR